MATRDRGGAKWDRAARYLRIVHVLHGHPEGIRVDDIADQIGVSRRTIYRDLEAMSLDGELPVWQEAGKWGLDASAFLPPLALTLDEATTFVLAARVLAKASDERDTELISAYVKLAGVLPPVLAAHLRAIMDAYANTPPNERFTRVFRTLTQAWAERRVVEIEYGPSAYEPGKGPRKRRIRPFAIEPSAHTHALYLIGFDETVGARRTFKVERVLSASLTPEVFEESTDRIARDLLQAWDVVVDEPLSRVAVRFSPEVAARVSETRWHPTQEVETAADGSLVWSAKVSGLQEVRGWILSWGGDAEALEPAELRSWVREQTRRTLERYT
jgi:predicted DNA-binding transcriptional regulator YafY